MEPELQCADQAGVFEAKGKREVDALEIPADRTHPSEDNCQSTALLSGPPVSLRRSPTMKYGSDRKSFPESKTWLSANHRSYEGVESAPTGREEDCVVRGSGEQGKAPEDLLWSRVHRYQLRLRLQYVD